MATVFPLSKLDSISPKELERALEEAPRHSELRSAVGDIIRSVHGLPEVMECELSQLDVYIGRAGSTFRHVRARWGVRFESFERAPSTHSVVAVRGNLTRVKQQKWEEKAQRVLGVLTRNSALCCANAVTGDCGRWPDTRDVAIYVVARRRRGPAGSGVTQERLNHALGDLLDDSRIPTEVVREVGRSILRPDEGLMHQLASVSDLPLQTEATGVAPVCRSEFCNRPPMLGNFGFCGLHRRLLSPCRLEGCRREARPGNYGFCSIHR